MRAEKHLCSWSGVLHKHLNIPFTVGGGIGQLGDIEALLSAGADKVSINSAAIRDPGPD